MKIKEYKQPIFPYTLWVMYTTHIVDVKHLFYVGRDKEEITLKGFDFSEATTFSGQCKDTNSYGAIVVFQDLKFITVKNMAHEAVHAVDYLLYHIGEDTPGIEIQAYLTGWVAECLEEFKNNL